MRPWLAPQAETAASLRLISTIWQKVSSAAASWLSLQGGRSRVAALSDLLADCSPNDPRQLFVAVSSLHLAEHVAE